LDVREFFICGKKVFMFMDESTVFCFEFCVFLFCFGDFTEEFTIDSFTL
jgi:hypothetical protein